MLGPMAYQFCKGKGIVVVSKGNVISGVCCGINEEVQRVVKVLKFAPAMQNGIKMRMNVMMNFPVKAH